MDDREKWWNRYKVQTASVQKFVSDARTEEQLEALDAFQDVLDKLRGEYLEDTQSYRQANRAELRGKPTKGLNPVSRAAALMLASWLSRMALECEWRAAGLRARLKRV